MRFNASTGDAVRAQGKKGAQSGQLNRPSDPVEDGPNPFRFGLHALADSDDEEEDDGDEDKAGQTNQQGGGLTKGSGSASERGPNTTASASGASGPTSTSTSSVPERAVVGFGSDESRAICCLPAQLFYPAEDPRLERPWLTLCTLMYSFQTYEYSWVFFEASTQNPILHCKLETDPVARLSMAAAQQAFAALAQGESEGRAPTSPADLITEVTPKSLAKATKLLMRCKRPAEPLPMKFRILEASVGQLEDSYGRAWVVRFRNRDEAVRFASVLSIVSMAARLSPFPCPRGSTLAELNASRQYFVRARSRLDAPTPAVLLALNTTSSLLTQLTGPFGAVLRTTLTGPYEGSAQTIMSAKVAKPKLYAQLRVFLSTIPFELSPQQRNQANQAVLSGGQPMSDNKFLADFTQQDQGPMGHGRRSSIVDGPQLWMHNAPFIPEHTGLVKFDPFAIIGASYSVQATAPTEPNEGGGKAKSKAKANEVPRENVTVNVPKWPFAVCDVLVKEDGLEAGALAKQALSKLEQQLGGGQNGEQKDGQTETPASDVTESPEYKTQAAKIVGNLASDVTAAPVIPLANRLTAPEHGSLGELVCRLPVGALRVCVLSARAPAAQELLHRLLPVTQTEAEAAAVSMGSGKPIDASEAINKLAGTPLPRHQLQKKVAELNAASNSPGASSFFALPGEGQSIPPNTLLFALISVVDVTRKPQFESLYTEPAPPEPEPEPETKQAPELVPEGRTSVNQIPLTAASPTQPKEPKGKVVVVAAGSDTEWSDEDDEDSKPAVQAPSTPHSATASAPIAPSSQPSPTPRPVESVQQPQQQPQQQQQLASPTSTTTQSTPVHIPPPVAKEVVDETYACMEQLSTQLKAFPTEQLQLFKRILTEMHAKITQGLDSGDVEAARAALNESIVSGLQRYRTLNQDVNETGSLASIVQSTREVCRKVVEDVLQPLQGAHERSQE